MSRNTHLSTPIADLVTNPELAAARERHTRHVERRRAHIQAERAKRDQHRANVAAMHRVHRAAFDAWFTEFTGRHLAEFPPDTQIRLRALANFTEQRS